MALVQGVVYPEQELKDSIINFSNFRGGKWSFQKYVSCNIFVKFLGSHSLDFCMDVSISESQIFAR